MTPRARKPKKRTLRRRKPTGGADIDEAILAAMAKASLPPEFAYAYRKTGLLGLAADKSAWPEDAVNEWNAAVDEYRAIAEANLRPDKPEDWGTAIPDLLVSNQADYDQVMACLRAIEPIEAESMKVVTRIELAAALMFGAYEAAYKSGVVNIDDGPMAFAWAEEMVLRRAREIYAQGHG